jgi:hypothetical protein
LSNKAFDNARTQKNGLIPVKIGYPGYWTVIDYKGNEILPKFDAAVGDNGCIGIDIINEKYFRVKFLHSDRPDPVEIKIFDRSGTELIDTPEKIKYLSSIYYACCYDNIIINEWNNDNNYFVVDKNGQKINSLNIKVLSKPNEYSGDLYGGNSISTTTRSEPESSDEWTSRKVPLDIMNRITIGMNLNFLKEKLGEPNEMNQQDYGDYYTWNCDCLDITVFAKNNSIRSIIYSSKDCPNKKEYYIYVFNEKVVLGKSAFKTSEDDFHFAIEPGIQSQILYTQKIYGSASNNNVNYTLQGQSWGYYYSDFESYFEQTEEQLTVDKLPSDFRKSVIADASKTPIENIYVD